MTTLNIPLKDHGLLKSHGYINGRWVEAKSKKTFEIKDPASMKLLGTMPDMGEDDVKDAVQAADAALQTWRNTTARHRSDILHRWYELMMANIDDITALICYENGKVISDARAEAVYAANYFQWFSEEAARLYGDTIPATSEDRRIYTRKEPVGVVGLITPWNWPAGMVTRKIGPALAAGCTVVFKGPGETPLTSAALMVLGERAGVPPGVVNIVTSLSNTVEVGAAMTESSIIRKISFTGSTRVGKILMSQASSTLKKCSFELGGNAPFIVFEDADLDLAVAGAVACKFRSTGQTCVCANRIYVHRKVYDAFANAMVEQVKKFKIGPGYEQGTTHGPMIHERALDKVQEHIADAIKKGGKVIFGGEKLPKLGPAFIQPAVIRDMTQDMLVAQEETFGPIAGLFPFDTEAEVVKLANDSTVGLGAFFYSQDILRCYRVAEAIQSGMVGVNSGIISDVPMPFGGVKESGFGREGSKYGIDEYIVIKAVTIGGVGKPLQGS